jgi:TRAP-type C4-dicarboxylate transport system permease small subunit
MNPLERVIATLTTWVGSAVLLLMALQIVVDVFMRNVVGAGFPATADLVSKYYMIAVSFLPVAFSEIKRRHVEASIFTDMMPKWTHPPLYALGFALSLVAYGILTWGTAREAMVQTSRGAYVEAGTIIFYTWPGYWILPICFVLMAAVIVMRLIQVLTGTFADVASETAIVTDELDLQD